LFSSVSFNALGHIIHALVLGTDGPKLYMKLVSWVIWLLHRLGRVWWMGCTASVPLECTN